MAYGPLTAAQFKAKYPAFGTTDDQVVTDELTWATGRVVGWSDEDGPLGISYLAAHNLTLNGHGTGAKVAAQRAQGVQSMKSGSFAAEFTQHDGTDSSLMNLTSWGRRYLELLGRYAGGPFVARAGGVDASHLSHQYPYVSTRRW